jgi:hypothetical protein
VGGGRRRLALWLAQGVAGRLLDAATTYLCLSLGLQEVNPRAAQLLPRPELFIPLQILAGALLGLLSRASELAGLRGAERAPPEWRGRLRATGRLGALAIAAINWFPVPWNLLQAALALAARP